MNKHDVTDYQWQWLLGAGASNKFLRASPENLVRSLYSDVLELGPNGDAVVKALEIYAALGSNQAFLQRVADTSQDGIYNALSDRLALLLHHAPYDMAEKQRKLVGSARSLEMVYLGVTRHINHLYAPSSIAPRAQFNEVAYSFAVKGFFPDEDVLEMRRDQFEQKLTALFAEYGKTL